MPDRRLYERRCVASLLNRLRYNPSRKFTIVMRLFVTLCPVVEIGKISICTYAPPRVAQHEYIYMIVMWKGHVPMFVADTLKKAWESWKFDIKIQSGISPLPNWNFLYYSDRISSNIRRRATHDGSPWRVRVILFRFFCYRAIFLFFFSTSVQYRWPTCRWLLLPGEYRNCLIIIGSSDVNRWTNPLRHFRVRGKPSW